jgi:putative peptidoglycan lipid II flippase
MDAGSVWRNWNEPMAMTRQILTVGGGTAVSRLVGFLRDIMIAAALGSGLAADAFIVAFRLPNLFRRMLAEGGLNAAFVPIYGRKLERDGVAAAARFAGNVLAIVALLLAGLGLLAHFAMPQIIFLLAPGFAAAPAKMALTIRLSHIVFPFLGLAVLSAICASLLNATHHFRAAAAAPIVFNLVIVAALVLMLVFPPNDATGIAVGLCWAVTIAGLAQLLVCGFAVRRAGLAPTIPAPRLDAETRRFLSASLPGVLAGGLAQVNVFIGTIIGSASASVVSYLYYADRVYQLPLGIFGAAMGLILLPELTRRLAAGDEGGARLVQQNTLELALVLTLPSAVGLAIAARPIVEVLFERGAFDAEATRATASALATYGLGLPGYVLAKVLHPGFFARHDLRTPLLVALAGALVDLGVALWLFPVLAQVGIAVAATAAGWFNAVVLTFILWRRRHLVFDSGFLRRVLRLVGAAALMGGALSLYASVLASALVASRSVGVKAGALLVLCSAGAATYFLIAWLAGCIDPGRLWRRAPRAG